ncbi:glycosyltransferase family 2 protein [Fulvivirga sp. 29W222]|uniref:Glycosyltransferase family 2 protein n=1 Tax=Fulvivirga marina TaxID=2494733 RepID=A0A937KDS2_9BACT|nr:glycosyltransferase family A protein [Fulvivirga marina]MBL6448937.1 glycosyltransferase family 2 protein [Fulvivirga marina]
MEDQSPSTIKENIYLSRYAFPGSLLNKEPHKGLELVITIPCYNEPDPIRSLNSLLMCNTQNLCIEVILLINEAENAPSHISLQNEKSYQEVKRWAEKHSRPDFYFHVIYKNDLPKKHAGVGLARKIAMDEAVRRLESVGRPDGVIICYDADSTCDPNYIQAVHDYFYCNSKSPGCSIYFEHPLEGSFDDNIYDAIIDYELFLRYYVNALRYSGFPYAYETIGSSMAVRSSAYQKQGGMNRRKAGEDFYFLHKIIPLGNFGEVNNTRVIPSPRISDRVPFGTGKAVNDWQKTRHLSTYAIQTFKDLKCFIDSLPELYNASSDFIETFLSNQPESIRSFLVDNDFICHTERINNNAASINTFIKHFYQWFDGFKVLKYVHYARDNFYPNQSIGQVASELLTLTKSTSPINNKKDILLAYRKMDRQVHY